MISSFADGATADFFHGVDSARARRWAAIEKKIAHRKLDMMNAAAKLDDLKVPPGNRLEALKGNLAGYHSIRINDQWRIVFKWRDGAAHEVRIDDYH
jgi:proteic killer suppression protein